MSERVTEEDCFNVYWNGEGEMPSHLCAADFARELSLARARVKDLEEAVRAAKKQEESYVGCAGWCDATLLILERVLRGEEKVDPLVAERERLARERGEER